MQIGVPLETAAGETRVAATPETVKKYVAQGHTVRVAAGAGLAAAATDAAYQAAGAQIVSQAEALAAELVLKVRRPGDGEQQHHHQDDDEHFLALGFGFGAWSASGGFRGHESAFESVVARASAPKQRHSKLFCHGRLCGPPRRT